MVLLRHKEEEAYTVGLVDLFVAVEGEEGKIQSFLFLLKYLAYHIQSIDDHQDVKQFHIVHILSLFPSYHLK